MSACFENIIGIRAVCSDDIEPLSGYYITDYAGITLQSASNVADEKTKTGYDYLVDLRRRAMKRLSADIHAKINQEYRVNSFVTNSFRSGEVVMPLATISAGTNGQRRGLVIASQRTHCRFYKMTVNRVRISSQTTGDYALQITDVGSGTVLQSVVSLEAGITKEFEINKPMLGNEIHITIPSDVAVYSMKPDCGCGGKAKQDYFTFNGISNGVTNTTQSYGIECDITLKCDLSALICDMANDGIIGQCAYELCGAMFYDEMTKTNRFNYLTIYKADEIKAQAQAGFEAYSNYMNAMFAGLRNYLVNNDGNCGCVDCSGVQIKANV
jgi:hypothetical protein